MENEYVGYSIEDLKKIIGERPEEIKKINRLMLKYSLGSKDSTGYLDYVELASIALSKNGMLFEYVRSQLRNKEYVDLAKIAIINNYKAFEFVEKRRKNLNIDENGVVINTSDLLSLDESDDEILDGYEELRSYSNIFTNFINLEFLNKD